MRERTIDAIVAGHVCLDIIPRFPNKTLTFEEAFQPGKLINVEEATLATGGAVSNTGIPLARLGARTTLMARVGRDYFGRMTIDILSRSASTEGIVEHPQSYSSYTVALAPPGIDRIFYHAPAANDTFGAEDVNADLCGQTRLFHLGYPPLMRRMYADGGRELIEIFKKVKDAGATTSLDMSLPDPNSEAGQLDWVPIFERLLPLVDLFHPSIEEGLYMADRPTYDRLRRQAPPGGEMLDLLNGEEHSRLAERLLGWGAAVVTLKSGHRGFYARTGSAERLGQMGAAAPGDGAAWAERELWLPALVPPQGGSTTGAGDCSLAGFLAAFLKGQSLEAAMACAGATAWQSLRSLDATSGVGDWPETSRIATDATLPRLDLQPTAPGWRREPGQRCWRGPNDRP